MKQHKNFPNELNAIVEISANSDPIKYEIKDNELFVDRFIPVSMRYPCNYAFLPETHSDDGDPMDVLIITRFPVIPKAVIKVRPIGVLCMSDEAGLDHKILSVPTTDLEPCYSEIKNYTDISKIILDQITHFFDHYKDLEKSKHTEILGWESADFAINLLKKHLEPYYSQIK